MQGLAPHTAAAKSIALRSYVIELGPAPALFPGHAEAVSSFNFRLLPCMVIIDASTPCPRPF